MADEGWRPLWARKPGKQEEFDALAEGVPRWLSQALTEWLNKFFLLEEGPLGQSSPSSDRLLQIEISLRLRHVTLGWNAGTQGAYLSLLKWCDADGDVFLSVLDLALRTLGGEVRMQRPIDDLDSYLKYGGSAWTVAPDRRSLVRRVQPQAAEAARQIIESGSRAGKYLAEAWRHTYGRDPNPSSGYREAVRAVEAAVCPVIIPTDPKATLGKAIRAVQEAPSERFTTVFEDNAPDTRPLDAVRGVMSLIWTNQLDRHGTTDEDVSLHVSQPQAEAALHAAVMLVQWFQSRVVRRAEP